MRFPQRAPEHIIESDSLTILRKSLPSEWVVRELSERDYGIDLYVELVGKDLVLAGEMVALQLKGTKKLNFVNGQATFKKIKRETLNYWLSLPVPVFLCVVCIETSKCYWVNIESQHRAGRFKGDSKTVSLPLVELCEFATPSGLNAFKATYIREKQWPRVEEAIEKSLMLFNTLGPLVLMCMRGKDNANCSTTVQYLINQHYEHYVLLCTFLKYKKPVPLSHWYHRNRGYFLANGLSPTLTMYHSVLKEMFTVFLSDYRNSILAAYEMVMETRAWYFEKRFPYLTAHLKDRPHTFVGDDWFTRYVFDEYEDETSQPHHLYFNDFDVFGDDLSDLGRT